MRIFIWKTEKRRGAFFKNRKNSGGGTLFGRGFTGNFLGRKNSGRNPLKNKKTQEGVPFGEGGLPENFEERKTAGRGYPFGRGFTGKIWKKGNFILYLWGRIRIE